MFVSLFLCNETDSLRKKKKKNTWYHLVKTRYPNIVWSLLLHKSMTLRFFTSITRSKPECKELHTSYIQEKLYRYDDLYTGSSLLEKKKPDQGILRSL